MGKIYLFFTWYINGIGGLQLYINHKTDFLHKEGWTIYVVSGDDYPDLLMDNCFDKIICEPSILFPEYYFFPNQRKKVIAHILNLVPKDFMECVIESHGPQIATWAESVAQMLSAKHIVFNSDERPICPTPLKSFFLFKLKRRELAGITYDCSKFFIEQFSSSMPYNPELIAWGANECVQDVNYDLSKLTNGLFTIGLLGRLSKSYMKDTVKEICKFVCDNKEKVNIIYIGGEPNKYTPIRHRLEREYKNLDNINLIFTGTLYPVPRMLVHRFDVCIAGAGSSIAMTKEGIPTICVDPRDCKATGVLGITTMTTIYSIGKKTDKQPISQVLKDIKANPNKYKPPKFDILYEFEEHLKFLSNSNKERDYNISFLERYNVLFFLYKLVFYIFKPMRIIKAKSVVKVLLRGK